MALDFYTFKLKEARRRQAPPARPHASHPVCATACLEVCVLTWCVSARAWCWRWLTTRQETKCFIDAKDLDDFHRTFMAASVDMCASSLLPVPASAPAQLVPGALTAVRLCWRQVGCTVYHRAAGYDRRDQGTAREGH